MASFWIGIPVMLGGQKLAQIRSAIARLRGHAGFWLSALSQPTIDLTLRTHAGLRTRIVESPGLSLSEAELEALVSQLRIVAARRCRKRASATAFFPASASGCRAPSSP